MAERARAEAATENRRVCPRYPAEGIPAITAMRLSPGGAVALVNISESGALVASQTRFVPGVNVSVSFEGSMKPKPVKGRIVRCQVSAISKAGLLTYHTAIAFDKALSLPVGDAASESALDAAGEEDGEVVDFDETPEPPASPRLTNRW
jgi:hypothetical protein